MACSRGDDIHSLAHCRQEPVVEREEADTNRISNQRSATMRIDLNFIAPMLATGAAAAAAGAICATPIAAGQPAQPTPTTVTVMAPAPGPPDNQSCTSSATSTKCLKNGDAEINAAIPAPFPGPFSAYGPFYAGGAG